MELILNNVVQIILMNGMILLIPGVNFLLIARQSILNGVQAGFFCACGITTAIMSHVLLSALSVSVLLTKYPAIFTGIRYGGAVYLVYLGTLFILRSKKQSQQVDLHGAKKQSFRSGFFVDLLNPFISIFYLTLFSGIQFGSQPVLELSCYMSVIFALVFVWFSFVAVFFNHSLIRETLQSKARYIQILSGCAMYFFSAKVVFGF